MRSLLVSVLMMTSLVHAENPVTPANAAELAIHQTRLMTTIAKPRGGGKRMIPSFFKTAFATLTREEPAKDAVEKFKFVIATYPDKDGKRSELTLPLGEDGRPAKNNAAIAEAAVLGGEPEKAPTWSDKDAASLAEEGLHFILQNADKTAELKPYRDDFKALTLSADATGASPLAIVEVTSSTAKDVLRIEIEENGTYKSHKFVKSR